MFQLLDPVMLWAAGIGVFLLLVVIAKSIVVVRGTDIAILERKYLGQKMPQGRVIAMANQVGIQARTLGPGLHLVVPFLFIYAWGFTGVGLLSLMHYLQQHRWAQTAN